MANGNLNAPLSASSAVNIFFHSLVQRNARAPALFEEQQEEPTMQLHGLLPFVQEALTEVAGRQFFDSSLPAVRFL